MCRERGCGELEGTLAEQLQQVVNFLRAMEMRCVQCQVRLVGTCPQCHLGWCTLCQQAEEKCDVYSAPMPPVTNFGAANEEYHTQGLKDKRMKGAEVIASVNMHQLGENFVERECDVRRRTTVNGQAAAPGESLEFLAQIRGWQSEARKQRRDQLLQLKPIGLRAALTCAAGTDIFFIPLAHFAKVTPEHGDEGWWYQVQSVIWCRECQRCGGRQEQAGFELKEWHKDQPAMCARCSPGRRDEHRGARNERRANGMGRVSTTKRGCPEQPMGEGSSLGIHCLSLTWTRRRGLNGVRACTGCVCLQHPLSMLDESTTSVGAKWCIPYRKSRHFSTLNQTMYDVG